jgi:hypothetical protein
MRDCHKNTQIRSSTCNIFLINGHAKQNADKLDRGIASLRSYAPDRRRQKDEDENIARVLRFFFSSSSPAQMPITVIAHTR